MYGRYLRTDSSFLDDCRLATIIVSGGQLHSDNPGTDVTARHVAVPQLVKRHDVVAIMVLRHGRSKTNENNSGQGAVWK